MEKKVNVLSLFNGMNTGRQALENQGFKIGNYYSSEIKPYAIKLTQHHFPDTIQLGDVTKWKDVDCKVFRMIIVIFYPRMIPLHYLVTDGHFR